MRLFSDASETVADPWLRQAFALAELGRGTTSPNPLVGCVIVRNDVVVGEGYHERAGSAHAEVSALAQAGDLARGAHVAVTLEPCNHAGRTPPCVEGLLEAGVASVGIGMPDPNPGVVGGGADRLRAAGVAVEFAADRTPFIEQNQEWLSWLERGRPFVRVKVALTLDGRPTLERGRRTRITGRGGARVAMRLRACSDAVIVGANTLAVDDPHLTVRDESGARAAVQPQRVVLSRVTIPGPEAEMFHDGAGTVVVLVSDAASLEDAGRLHAAGADVRHYMGSTGLTGALEALGEDGIVSVLVEPGPALFGALWDSDLIDELVLLNAGGIAGTEAPGLYPWAAGPSGPELERSMYPVEAGVSAESAGIVWKRTSDPTK